MWRLMYHNALKHRQLLMLSTEDVFGKCIFLRQQLFQHYPSLFLLQIRHLLSPSSYSPYGGEQRAVGKEQRNYTF